LITWPLLGEGRSQDSRCDGITGVERQREGREEGRKDVTVIISMMLTCDASIVVR